MINMALWAVAPVILLLILCNGLLRVPEKVGEPKIRASTRAGKFAGLIVLVLFMISQKKRDFNLSLNIPSYEFDLWPTLIGAAAGFIVYGLFSFLKPARAVGLRALAIVGSTSIALYSYFFISGMSKTVMFGTLGILLGVLFYDVILPVFMREDTGENREDGIGE
jgi:uncharacterized membrane protein AbrB (regulator of aidB expression)